MTNKIVYSDPPSEWAEKQVKTIHDYFEVSVWACSSCNKKKAGVFMSLRNPYEMHCDNCESRTIHRNVIVKRSNKPFIHKDY